jgi:hypothetical protein
MSRKPINFPTSDLVFIPDINLLKPLQMANPKKAGSVTEWNIIKVGHGSEGTLHEISKVDGETVLKVLYPKNSFKPSAKPEGGIGFYSCPNNITPSSGYLTLSYELFFDKNFDPQLGGKLPGLFMGPPGASGGRHSNDNASCRLMWRTFSNKFIKVGLVIEAHLIFNFTLKGFATNRFCCLFKVFEDLICRFARDDELFHI